MTQQRASGGIVLPSTGRGLIGLVIANVVGFVVYLVLLRLGLDGVASALELHPDRVLGRGHLWQLLTSLFVHSPFGVGHLAFNMLFLWWFGAEVEATWGSRRFVVAYLLAGLAGAVTTVAWGGLTHLVAPESGLASAWTTATYGASGAVYGITAAWGGLLWYEVRNFFLIGPVRVRTFLIVIVAIELLSALAFTPTSATSHLGGLAMGFALGRGWLLPDGLDGLLNRRRERAADAEHARKLSRFTVIEGGKQDAERPPKR